MSTPTVVFVCPHNIAKSLIAAAWFQRLADARGLSLRALSAGTEPSDAVPPVVVDLMRADGFDVSGHRPRRVTAGELRAARKVVSLGCEPADLEAAGSALERWDDLPAVLAQPVVAREAIIERVRRLVDDLASGAGETAARPAAAPRVPHEA